MTHVQNRPGVAVPGHGARQLAEGLAHLRAGRLREAEAAFGKVLDHDQRSVDAWDGLGLAAYRSRRFDRAERAFRRALSLKEDSPDIKQRLAATLRSAGQPEAAIAVYEELAKRTPNNAGLLNNWGNALVDARRFEEAVGVLRRAVEANPAPGLFRVNLAKALLKLKRDEEAVQVLEEARARGNDDLEIVAELGNALLAVGRYREAVDCFHRARDAGHGKAGMFHNLGTAAQYLGDMKAAEEAYRAALAADPDFAVSRRQLAGIRKYEASDGDLEELGARLKEKGLSVENRSEIYLGLAKAFDDIGKYDKAFANLQAGNQLIRTTINYSAEGNSAFIDEMIRVFGHDFLRTRSAWGLDTDRPIFIVGMPRSGTTLTEQILCSHPKVFGAGELMTIYEIVSNLRHTFKSDQGIAPVATLLTSRGTQEAAQTYCSYISSLNSDAPFVSDKLPFNYRYLGYISLFFPRARIIHCTRDPLDISLSCYFARFKDQLSFSFNLTELGRYYQDYRRLMDHWSKVIANPMLEVSYEKLVADQEGETRRMLEFCGLEWDDRCLDFHQTERPVLTASNWQVRQPMYASSVGRWRNYERHLGPLIALLRSADRSQPAPPSTPAEPQRPIASH